MMLHFAPFRAEHLNYLAPQPEQEGDYTAMLLSGQGAQLEGAYSISGWAGARCVGVAGMIPLRPHKALAWAILSRDAAPYMIAISRKVRRVISASPFVRVELTVNAEFEMGSRFARAIGAKLETITPMRHAGANGEDEYMYAVVKDTKWP